MNQGVLFTTIGAIAITLLSGCLPATAPTDPGGLSASHFVPVSYSGFDLIDDLFDKNDYAWGMSYFRGDQQSQGFVYVATGNAMVSLMSQGMGAMTGTGELGSINARPPEIRRYRPDYGNKVWERVFDYRNVENDPDFKTIGFRYMTTYRARSNGANYLYAATFGANATVWRSRSGDPLDWELTWQSGEMGSVRMMAEHNGILYLALANDTPVPGRIGKIWATDGSEFWPVVQDGFGDPNNVGIMSLISFNGWLYAGTMNTMAGYQVWKLDGPEGSSGPTLVVANGGPSSTNESAVTPCVFNNQLYWGAMIYMLNMLDFKGADIIRINPDDTWETVVGPNAISAYGPGFNHWPNTYIWSMGVYNGWLYSGTYDMTSSLTHMVPSLTLSGLPGRLTSRPPNLFDFLLESGADMYKTQDGVTWYPVTLNGFGNGENYGFRTMLTTQDGLYVGTANPFTGLQIWKGTNPG